MRPLPLRSMLLLLALVVGGACSGGEGGERADPIELLNVSYDPTRELYEDFNKAFATEWKREHTQEVTMRMSHGGSGRRRAR